MSKDVILIIEDQKSMASFLEDKLAKKTDIPILVAHDLKEAQQIIESDVKILVCLTDLNLPGSEEGASVPLLREHNISTVVLTVNYTEKTRQIMYEQHVADYVIKDGAAALEYATNRVINLIENSTSVVWLLSKQGDNCHYLRSLMSTQRYRVFLFEDFDELSRAVKGKAPDMVILNQIQDYSSDAALKLVQLVRYHYSASQLPIIMSDTKDNTNYCIKMMKYGVNDFFTLESSVEEIFLRMRLNLLQSQNYKEIERISQTDSLTGLYNRRYFFEHADRYFNVSYKDEHFAAMVDIDFFKKVNDTYGHKKGDEAIKFMANAIRDIFKGYLIARFGGEEFCIAGSSDSKQEITELCEELRSYIEQKSAEETGIPFTASLGLSFNDQELSKAVVNSDEALYSAKEGGRNQVVCHSC